MSSKIPLTNKYLTNMGKNNINTGMTNNAAHVEVINALRSDDIALMYCDTLSEIAMYITMADDPDLEAERQLHWLRTIALIRKDLQTLATD